MCCFFLICDQKKKVTDATASGARSVSLSRSWTSRLRDEFELEYMQELRTFLIEQKQQGKKIYPPGKQIFNALNSTSFETTNVVILGQDPYHDINQAKRLANDIIYLERGQVKEYTKGSIFFKKPSTLSAQKYISGIISDV